MVSNTTRNIDGVDYTFGDDGSWVAPRTTAPKGHITGGRYYNTWSNLCIPQIIGTTEADFEAADQYTGGEYAAIGRPSLTHDLYMSTDFGDVEVYYLNMKDKQDMDRKPAVLQGNSKRKEDIKNVLLPQAGRLYGSCPDNWKNQRCSFSQQHRYEYDNSTVIK